MITPIFPPVYRKLCCLLAASCLPFIFTLQGDFVFDDSEAITKNHVVISNNWTDLFYTDYWGRNIKSKYSHKSYRPLTTLSFRVNYYLNGKEFSAVQFKITNLICHIVCTVLVWQSFEKLTKNVVLNRRINMLTADLGFTAAMLYAVHPVHVEAVSGIVGRADILAGITFFSSFLVYNKAVTTKKLQYFYLCLSVILATIALLFKESGVTVLGFCIFYELVRKFNSKFNLATFNMKYFISNSAKRIALLTVCAVLLLCARWVIMGNPPEFQAVDNPAAFANNLFTRVATYNYIYFINTLLFIWPQWLCYDWSMGCIPVIESITDYRVIFIILLYVYVILGIRSILNKRNCRSTKRSIILAALLIIIPFLPAANIIFPVGFVIAERVLYISSAGYCLLVAIGLHKMISTYKNYKTGVVLYIVLILFYGLRSWQRSAEWQNEYRLFTSGLPVCPQNAKVHYNIAKVADYVKNDKTWALQEYKEAIILYPQYIQAMNNLGNLLKKQKKYAEAEQYFKTALSLKKDFPVAWMNLGIVLCNAGRYEESRDAYETALKYRSNYPDCYFNLGNLYLEMKDHGGAMDNWLKAINLNSSHTLAWTNLLILLVESGKPEQALDLVPKVLEKLPNAPNVHFAIGNIYGKMERYEEAETHFIKAINLFDKKVEAVHYTNLGVLYHRWNKLDLAKEMYLTALKINPSFQSALNHLKSITG